MSKFLTAFVLLLALSQLAAPTSTASAGTAAAATCYGSAFNGLNHKTTGCSADGYVVSEVELYDDELNYVGMVYRYWSPMCQAAWTRVESDFRADGVQANVYSSSPSNSYAQSNMNVYTANSPMVYATAVTYTTSCGTIQEGSLLAFACAP
jgi:hypothetical protein